MTSEGYPKADSSLLGHEKNTGWRLLELDGSSQEEKGQKEPQSKTPLLSSGIKKVSTSKEDEGKTQEAPNRRVQEEGKPSEGIKGGNQKEVEDDRKPPRLGYQGPAEERQEGQGKVHKG